jgi:hypothetical protein
MGNKLINEVHQLINDNKGKSSNPIDETLIIESLKTLDYN